VDELFARQSRRQVFVVLAMAAIFNLNHPPHIVHWHFIYLSVPNIVVIGVMLVVFALAILLPFPKHRVDRGGS
jgi:hypothetical protein